MHKIIDTQDGSSTLLSDQFEVTYHSKYGAIEESTHVFINAGLLKLYEEGLRDIRILEYGFGTGLNALLTFMKTKELEIKVQYVGLELYPLSQDIYQNLNYCTLLGTSADDLITVHEMGWMSDIQPSQSFSIDNYKIPFDEYISDAGFDLIYYDAFGPSTQPELWSQEMVDKIKFNMKPNGLLTTYCAKGSFKRALKQAGFEVIPCPGPTGKREMTTARLLAK